MPRPKKGNPPPNSVLDDLVKEAERLDDLTEGDEVSHALDEPVIDSYLRGATAINDGGYVSQLRYLVGCGAADEAYRALKELEEELGTEENKA